jgi:CRISPR-associated protein Csx14
VNHAKANITVKVDVTNPGQVFACCGLLELADRLWPGAEGWFADQTFCIVAADHSISLVDLLNETRSMQFDVGDDSDAGNDDEDDDGDVLPVNPILLKWKDGRNAIHLDWWSDKSIKPWAGSMKERIILRAMLTAIDPRNSDPFNDIRCVYYQSPKLTKAGKPSKPKKKEPFYFDPRRGNKSHPLDCGFSPDTHKMEADCCPALEAFCFIGLQRARPAPTGFANRSRYAIWPKLSPNGRGLPASLLGAVVSGTVRFSGSTEYVFDNYFRTDQRKHKAYAQATPTGKEQQ